MFTLDGVPLLYNGMEAGDATESGDPALFEKLPVFWHPRDRPPLHRVYHDLAHLRKEHPAFRNDQVIWLRNSDEANLVSFMRAGDQEQFLVVINFSNRPETGSVEVKHEQQFLPVNISGVPECSAAGFPTLRLNGFEWRIYRHDGKG